MRHHAIIAFVIVALALATGITLPGEALAGQYKDLHGAIPNAGCISAHSSPRNVSSAMAMEVYEFITPAADAYRCCITSNTTGQDLFVRLIGLTGAQLGVFQTAVNGVGCTAFINLGAGFAFQCTVASGAGSPVNATAHSILAACRQ
jgi:hypothetical protein